ncbi:MAG: hypothetical protein HY727_14190 [Candidatus Rokubacteria bacterium]|nr:hypothetical protein [Candidatus Rokubacteria bacterium]
MQRLIVSGLVASLLLCGVPAGVLAQQRQPPPSKPTEEIKLDEPTTLRAAALEARMSAILANFALLQRQAQDMQQEMSRMLEERKKLIEEAGKKASVEVKDTNEWAFDNKGQRYVKAKRP